MSPASAEEPRPKIADLIIRDENEVDPDTCDHACDRIRKYDGGRRPLLCERCYLIVGSW